MEPTPPPAPKVSPDGRFYWDGQRRVPLPNSAAPVPGPRYGRGGNPAGYSARLGGLFLTPLAVLFVVAAINLGGLWWLAASVAVALIVAALIRLRTVDRA
jgi:hypothetical protein